MTASQMSSIRPAAAVTRSLRTPRLTDDFSRIPGIMEERAKTFRMLFFLLDDPTLRVVAMRHTDAEWNADLSDLPEAIQEFQAAGPSGPR